MRAAGSTSGYRTAPRVLAGVAAACALAVSSPAAAEAQPGPQDVIRPTQLIPAWTVADGIACAGPLRGAVTVDPAAPGAVHYYVRGSFFGISSQSGRSCLVDATLSWRNLATGASGAVTGRVGRPWGPPPFSPDPVGRELHGALHTGTGPVEFTLSSDRPHLDATTLVQVG